MLITKEASSSRQAVLCQFIRNPECDCLFKPRTGYSGNTAERMIAEAAAQRRVSAVMRRRDTEPRGEFLVTIKVDVVDAHLAGLNTIHYLLKVFVFDL